MVEVETNVKLNLIDNNGRSMVTNKEEKETHLVLFETVTDTYDLSWRIFKDVFNKWRSPKLKFDDWVIVDFD